MSRMYRMAGGALALGSLAWLVSLLYGDTVFEGFRPSHAGDSMWTLVAWLSLIGGLLVLIGIWGWFGRQAGRMSPMGMWGMGLTAASGMIFGAGFGVVEAVAVPAMSAGDRAAWDFYGSASPPGAIGMLFILAVLLFVVGAVMLGWATVKAGVWAAWSGWGLLVSGALALVVTLLQLGGLKAPLLADLPYMIFMVLGIYWGWQLWEPERAIRTAPAGAHA